MQQVELKASNFQLLLYIHIISDQIRERERERKDPKR